MKDFMKDPFTDYYFSKRDGRAFFHARKFLLENFVRATGRESDDKLTKEVESRLSDKFNQIEKNVDTFLLNNLMGSFKYLKNQGKILLAAITIYGLATVFFGLSKSFYWSFFIFSREMGPSESVIVYSGTYTLFSSSARTTRSATSEILS